MTKYIYEKPMDRIILIGKISPRIVERIKRIMGNITMPGTKQMLWKYLLLLIKPTGTPKINRKN